jgi:hypothetical protein
MNVQMYRFLAVYLLSLLFPFGIWLGLLGYELWSFILLFCGWTPIAFFLAMLFGSDISEEH